MRKILALAFALLLIGTSVQAYNEEPAFTGDVTKPAGSTATTVTGINGASVPSSASLLSTNSSGQPVALSAGSQQTTISNNTAILLPHWRAAVARVMAGTGNAVIADVGNSTSIGVNDGGSPDQMQTSPMAQLTNMLNRNGVNANFQNRIGVTGETDVRLNTTGWTNGGAHIGGNNSTYASAAATQSFTAAQPFDTVVLYWYSNGTTATFSYDIDGGAATNVVTGTTTGNYTTTFTVPYGTHRIDINWVSAYPGVIGYNTYTSTKNRVDVFALGASGVTSAYFNGLNGYCQLSQDLTILHTMDINDYSHGVSLGQHIINVQAAITQYKACGGGDVLLVTDIPTVVGQNGGAPSNAVQQTYIAADNQLAVTNNLPIVDTATKWQSAAVSSAFYAGDGTHPLVSGIKDQAQDIFKIIGVFDNGGIVQQPFTASQFVQNNGENIVPFSATPAFLPTYLENEITLTGNITSFSMAAGNSGQSECLTFVQDATGSRTITGIPTNVHGFFTIGSTASKANQQCFTYSTNLAAWIAQSPGQTNQ